MHIQDRRTSAGSRSGSRADPRQPASAPTRRSTSSTASPPRRVSSATCTPGTSARSASRSRAARPSSPSIDRARSQQAGAAGIQEIVIGMAHRGRLNVLVDVWARCPRTCSRSSRAHHAEDLPTATSSTTRVSRSDVSTPGGPVHLSLAFNPSHLEIVNPVVEGSAKRAPGPPRRRQGRAGAAGADPRRRRLRRPGHREETLNLTETRGYGTRGTVHIVINNQIGFTTSDARDTARRSTAPTSSR